MAYYTPNVSLHLLQTIEQKENIFPKKWFNGNFTIVTRKYHLKIPKEQIQVTATGVSHKRNHSRWADHPSWSPEGSSVQICPANQWCIASLGVLGRDYEMHFLFKQDKQLGFYLFTMNFTLEKAGVHWVYIWRNLNFIPSSGAFWENSSLLKLWSTVCWKGDEIHPEFLWSFMCFFVC